MPLQGHARKAAAAANAAAGGAAQEQEEEDESSSDDEDDDAGVIDAKTQAQIFETILKIRRRDQSIYDAQAKFYSSSDGEDEAGTGARPGGLPVLLLAGRIRCS